MHASDALTLGGMMPNETDNKLAPALSLFVLFHSMVVRDGIDPKRAHEALLAIDEYRQTISPDIPGASVNEAEAI